MGCSPRTGDSDLADALDRLTVSGLVIRRGTPLEARFLFKHALVRDTAYASLLRRRRQVLHRYGPKRPEGFDIGRAAASEGPVSSRRVLTRAAQSATARKRTLLVTIMQVSPKRSTSWPDSKVPCTKAAEPAPLTHPY